MATSYPFEDIDRVESELRYTIQVHGEISEDVLQRIAEAHADGIMVKASKTRTRRRGQGTACSRSMARKEGDSGFVRICEGISEGGDG